MKGSMNVGEKYSCEELIKVGTTNNGRYLRDSNVQGKNRGCSVNVKSSEQPKHCQNLWVVGSEALTLH